MPIYEYACQACGHELDVLQKVSEPPLTDCPDCGEPTLRKRISAPQFRLKGSGWYETDFKSDKRRNVLDKDDAAAKNAKDESKPADNAAKSAAAESNSKGEKKASTKTGAPSAGKDVKSDK